MRAREPLKRSPTRTLAVFMCMPTRNFQAAYTKDEMRRAHLKFLQARKRDRAGERLIGPLKAVT